MKTTMLGYKVSGWKGMPMMNCANGMVSLVHYAGWSGPLSNLYAILWPMNEYVQGWSYAYGYRLFIDFGDGSKIGDVNYAISGETIGYLADSNIIYVRHSDIQGVEGFDVEIYYFVPMQDDYKNSFLIVVLFKNNSGSDKTFYAGLSNPNDYLRFSVRYSTGLNAVVSKNESDKTWIVGSSDQIDAAYLDDAWRQSDYTANNPGGYYIRWKFTVENGKTKVWTVLNVFGWSEDEATQLYNTLKSLDGQGLLEDNVNYWREWLNKGRDFKIGWYELDELSRIILCVLKGSITPIYSMPAGVTAYCDSEWPSDTYTAFWGLALWGHLEEAKNHYAIRIKNLVRYIQENNLRIYRDLHIAKLYSDECGSGYSGPEYFECPTVAVEVYKLCGDKKYAEDIWEWIEVIVDDIDANLISDGDFAGCFNWNHMNDGAVMEGWGPNITIGNICVYTTGLLHIACVYDSAALIADVVGEHSLASEYRSKANLMRAKVRNQLWNPSARQYWHYWADTEGYKMDNYENNHDIIWWVPAISNYVDERIKKSLMLYNVNLINLGFNEVEGDNILPSLAAGNWMYGKVEPLALGGSSKIVELWFWSIFWSLVKAGLDDLVMHWLKIIADEYEKNHSWLFDEWVYWNGTPGAGYTMRRSMGIFIVVMALLHLRPKPAPQRRFEYLLRRHGANVTIIKPVENGTDEFGNPIYVFERRVETQALISRLKADEEIVEAGKFTTEDVKMKFKAFTNVEEGDRILWDGNQYQIQTVQHRHYGSRIVWIETYAKKVVTND